MSIQERLQLVLKMHNLTPSAFADQIGVQRSNVSHVLSGRNKPGLDFLEKIVTNFPRVNARWLLTGEMPDQKEIVERNAASLVRSSDPELDQSHKKMVAEKQENLLGKSVGFPVKIVEYYEDGTFKVFLPSRE